jgi:hypothetical protein
VITLAVSWISFGLYSLMLTLPAAWLGAAADGFICELMITVE